MEDKNKREGHSQRVGSLESDRQKQVIVNGKAERIQSEGDVNMDQGSKESYITCPVCEL
jgi:hypothetical protein